MNEKQKELARKILDQVESQPATLAMETWETVDSTDLWDWETGETVEGCGTTRCIAGWAIFFSALPGESVDAARRRVGDELGLPSWPLVAAALLGLSEEEADSLFFTDEAAAVKLLREFVEED